MSRERFRFILILLGLVSLALLTSCNSFYDNPKGVVLTKQIKDMPKGIARFQYVANYGCGMYWFEDSAHFFMIGDTIIEIK